LEFLVIFVLPGEQTTFMVGSTTKATVVEENQPFQMMSELATQGLADSPRPFTTLVKILDFWILKKPCLYYFYL
jgi:hypothetical protein